LELDLDQDVAGLPISSFESVILEAEKNKNHLEGREILLYGGTGFIGTWLTSGLVYSNLSLNLKMKISIVTRDTVRARSLLGKRFSGEIMFHQHDLSKDIPNHVTSSDIVFHGATPSNTRTGSVDENMVLTATQNAALHACSLESKVNLRPNVIHLSSGIVYGPQPMDLRNRLATDLTVKQSMNKYMQAKLRAEEILGESNLRGEIDFQSPRLFAFAGPYMPLKEHFAVANFVSDGLEGRPILVKGNPNTLRSYMHPVDLVTILLKLVQPQIYKPLNIGSSEPISMIELAEMVSSQTSKRGVILENPLQPPSNYVPSMSEWGNEVKTEKLIALSEIIEDWATWISTGNQAK
jgi:dTDP-glucose 4,6-dehydratase